MDDLEVVGNAALGDSVPLVSKRAYVILTSPVTLRARSERGEIFKLTLPIGTELRLIAQSPEPRNQIPYLCQSDQWPHGFFRVGRNQRVEVREEVIG